MSAKSKRQEFSTLSSVKPPPPSPPGATATTFSPKIRVLIADDHPVVREGLAAMIGRQPDMVVVAGVRHGRHAVESWQDERPDVGLLDLRMPELDGLAALAQIRALDPSARVVLLTTFDHDEDVFRGMRAGAKAYLLKEASCEELLGCIRKVAAGQTVMPPLIAAKLAERVGSEELTDRERGVLGLLAQGGTNKEIGRDLSISETTVKSHVKSIFAKLRVDSRTEALAAANRRGLVRI